MALHIFIVHTEDLTQRAIRLHGVIQNMRLIAQNIGLEVKPYFVLTPATADISKDQDAYQKRINYDPTGIEEFDKLSKLVSMEILSNYDKHRKAWEMISENPEPKDMYMVVEDDVFLLPNNALNFAELLTTAYNSRNEWDMILMGLSKTDPKIHSPDSPMVLQNTRELFTVLPSKEAYLISPATARRMAAEFKTPIKFPMRIQLSWHIQKTSPTEFRVFNPSKQVTLDGSKLGLTPTTIHDHNVLMFNSEYMQLLEYMSKPHADVEKDSALITKIYESIASLNSPEIMQVYGILLFRAKRFKEAQSIMMESLENVQKQQGLLNSRSELLNNIIDMYKDMQTDIPELLKTKSKYSTLRLDPRM
jgi:hypothetical protein